MKSKLSTKPPSWAFWLLAGAISLYALWGVARVPFHPDESTYLFMSSDIDLLFSNPASIAWEATKVLDPQQRYRMIDAPITRYLLGLGRSITGLPALRADWNWGASWEDNQRAGSLPDEHLLLAGRLTIALLLPFSLFFMYLIGRRLGGEVSGLLAVALLGSNALIMLHTRRAMAEGALTFGVIFALWSFLDGWKRPWLAGLGMALAFNAKQSTIALLPVGLLAVVWEVFDPALGSLERRVKRALCNVLIYGAVFGSITLALNPFLWRDPFGAVQNSLMERKELLQQQVEDHLHLAPGKASLSPSERSLSLLANLYVLPPSFAETIQYQTHTAATEAVYMATPGHNLLRGLVGGGVMLILTLFGLITGILGVRGAAPKQRKALTLMLLATILQTGMLIIAVPLTWQRYVTPVAPLACLWAAYGLARLLKTLVSARPQTAYV